MIIIEFIIGILIALLARKLVDESDQQYEEQIKKEPVKVLVEIINNNYYGWLFDKNEFLLQSTSKNEFVKKLKQKFPDQSINLLSKEKIEWPKENKI